MRTHILFIIIALRLQFYRIYTTNVEALSEESEIKIEIASTWGLMGNFYVAKCEYAGVYDEAGGCQVVINLMRKCGKAENASFAENYFELLFHIIKI